MSLRRLWLTLARAAWIVVTAVTLGLFVLSLPSGYALLREVCVEKPCGPEQLSAEGARAIARLGLPIEWYAAYNVALVVIFALTFSVVAAVIFWRRSDDPMVIYTSLTLVLSGVFVPDWMSLLVPVHPSLWLVVSLLNSLTYICLFVLFYLFPDGRFAPRWTRWMAWVWAGLQLLVYAAPRSPLAPGNWPPALMAPVLVGLVGTCFFAQIYRYRRVSGPEQRQQTKLVFFGLMLMLGTLVLTSLPPMFVTSLGQPGTPYDLAVDLASFCAVLLVPVTFGAAILRYRLFDIDVLINRALIYGVLTIFLGLLYLGSVVGLQYVFRGLSGEGSSLAVVASTLMIATLFAPLRRRAQNIIDRRFYRRKYDAEKVMEAFSIRLRDETDLDSLSGDVVSVVRNTMQPEHIYLWLREPER